MRKVQMEYSYCRGDPHAERLLAWYSHPQVAPTTTTIARVLTLAPPLTFTHYLPSPSPPPSPSPSPSPSPPTYP